MNKRAKSVVFPEYMEQIIHGNGSNIGGTNMESDNAVAGKSGSGDGSGNQSENRVVSQREAALTKFRQKRSERCFRKKVRYQSRKKLAEQRPRVRGQFVRQTERRHCQDNR